MSLSSTDTLEYQKEVHVFFSDQARLQKYRRYSSTWFTFMSSIPPFKGAAMLHGEVEKKPNPLITSW